MTLTFFLTTLTTVAHNFLTLFRRPLCVCARVCCLMPPCLTVSVTRLGEISPLGKIFKVLGNFSRVHLLFWTYFGNFLHIIGQIFIDVDGQTLNNNPAIWSHFSPSPCVLHSWKCSSDADRPSVRPTSSNSFWKMISTYVSPPNWKSQSRFCKSDRL